MAAGTLIDYHINAATSVIANQAPQAPIETQEQLSETNDMDVFPPGSQSAENAAATTVNGRPPVPEIFQYGPLQIHPSLDYRVFYGNGIQAAPGEGQSTFVQQITPGILLDLGRHWALDYTPTINFYSSDQFRDGVDQSVTLTGGFDYEAWKFSLTHNSQFTEDPLVETGAQTDQTGHATTLTASHALNDLLSCNLGVSQIIDLVSGLQDSYDWSTMDWLNYQYRPRLTTGIGVGGGYVLIEGDNNQGIGNGDQTFEDLEGQVNWRVLNKLSFQLSAGAEDRQFSAAGEGSSLSPIFSLSIQYEPFQVTQITLSASRSVSSSDYYLAAQQAEVTSVGLNVNQRLLRRFSLGVGLGYSITDYDVPSGAGLSGANRTDNDVSFNVRLSHPFYKRGTWSLFYQYSDNDSTQQGFGFHSNQVGLEISYGF